MLRKASGRIRTDEGGFMLVEILVVILIIGVLAAIAIPAFLGQGSKAHDASAKSLVRTASVAAEAYQMESHSYSGMDEAALRQIEPTLADGQGSTLDVKVTGGGTRYTLTITSKSSNSFSIDKDATTGVSTRSCKRKRDGGCPPSLTW